jgi:hypothetical protein
MTQALLAARQRLEAKIEDLIYLLDLLDDDPDLEDGADDEPWLAGEQSCGGYDLEVDGDEQDYNGDEGDQSIGRLKGGCGL